MKPRPPWLESVRTLAAASLALAVILYVLGTLGGMILR